MAFRNLTEGNIPKLIVVMALPVLGSFVLQSLYTLADLYFVGLLGGAPLAGLGIAANTFFLVMALGRVIGVGTLAILAQSYGANRLDRVTQVYGQAFFLVILVGGGAWAGGLLAGDAYFGLFTTDPLVHAEGMAYFRIFSATFLLQLFMMVNMHAWRALGDFITPTLLITFSALMNLALDPLLIFGYGPVPAMGIAGAAWATVVSQSMVVLAFLWLIFFNRRNRLLTIGLGFRIDWLLLGRVLRIGLPSGLDFLLKAIVTMVMFRFIMPFGGDATAAVSVGFRLMQTSFFPPMAVCAAISSLVGQSYGVRNYQRVRESLFWGSTFAFGIMLFEYAAFQINPHFWVGLFASEAGIVEIGVQYLVTVGMVLPLNALGMAFMFGLQGMGRTFPPLVAMTGRLMVFVVALYVLEVAGLITPGAIFWASTGSILVEAAIMSGVMGYVWRKVLVVATPEEPSPDASPIAQPVDL